MNERLAFSRTWTTRLRLTLAVLLTALGVLLASSPAEAKDVDCTTPRKSLDTWLSNFQKDHHFPKLGAACFDWSGAGTPPKDRERLAFQLKKVLDARGLWVEMDEIPDDADHPEEKVIPFPHSFDQFYLVKKRNIWVISGASITATPALYEETFALNVDGLLTRLPDSLSFLRDGIAGIAYWQMLGIILCVAIALLVRSLTTWVVTSWGVRLLDRLKFKAGSKQVQKAARPIGTLLMAGVLWYTLPVLGLSAGVMQILVIALRVLSALAAVMVLYRVVDVVSDVFERRAELTESKLDDQFVPLVRKAVKVFVALIGFIFVLQNMDVDVGSLLAGASLGGLAFSLAARDTLANLFGGVSIFADRPFQIGDWVTIGGSAEGVVSEVGMRTTRIRTFYDSLITVPNAKIADSIVDNYGERTYRRVFTTLGVQYDTTPEQIHAFCDGIRAILKANESVRKDAYEIHFSGFGPSSLDVMVYFFLKVETWSEELRQRHNVYLEILRLARELGVQFAFPTQTLHIASQAAPSPAPSFEVPADDVMKQSVLAFAPSGKLSRPDGPKITNGFFPDTSQKGGDEDGDGG